MFESAAEKPSVEGESENIELYDRQPVSVTVGGTLKVLEKTQVQMNCTASGVPAPSISWHKEDNSNFSGQGGLLMFPRVALTDSGVYTCRTVNKAGQDTRTTVLEVVGKTSTCLVI